MAKLYFQRHSENCYTLEYHLEYMREHFEARREIGTGYFFCEKYRETEVSGKNCGKQCKNYSPRNKKNGICKYWRWIYERTDVIKKLKKPE